MGVKIEECPLCGSKNLNKPLGLGVHCKQCGLNITQTLKKNKGKTFEETSCDSSYLFVLRDNRVYHVGDVGIREYLPRFGEKSKKLIAEIDEAFKKYEKDQVVAAKANFESESGYAEGQMCPFTQVKIGGTRMATLAFTGASMNEFVWTHDKCIEDYCAIYDPKNKQCSIKTISQKLGK